MNVIYEKLGKDHHELIVMKYQALQIFRFSFIFIMRSYRKVMCDVIFGCFFFVKPFHLIFLIEQWQREKTNPPFPPHRNLTKSVVDGRLDANPRLRDGPGYPFVRDPLPRIPSDVAHNYRMDWERRNGHRNDFR